MGSLLDRAGRGVLRHGAECRGGAAGLLRERSGRACRARHGHAAGVPVSVGWVDKAASRLAARMGDAGFEEAMIAALAAEEVLRGYKEPRARIQHAQHDLDQFPAGGLRQLAASADM